ncbi:sulfotransferase [Thiorhodococcus drewsii AZ1]|uniref:Sulfotransferase n=1 Tax=Thiorhodococcus drewsii AZ1 TaxID=765913 RepID=G2E8C8_9GAMM|nr:sulfotransferase [Thiorhodococcus drewsii]EGV27640.1 sulfotransferase [Thiorhodococcus drewsii AZ1]
MAGDSSGWGWIVACHYPGNFRSVVLGQHPAICLAKSKEPDIFSGRWRQGLDAGKSEFAHPGRICLDASTSYSCACLPMYFPQDIGVESGFNGVPPRIHRVSPDARFIYIMRDPVARAFSSYWHEVRAGRETRAFEIAVRETTYFLRTSHYFGKIELFLEYFPLDYFLFLTFEDFIAALLDTARSCFRFLDLQDDVLIQQDRAQNKSFVYSGPWGFVNRLLAPIGGLNAAVRASKNLLPRRFLEWGAKRMTKGVPPVTNREYALLAAEFQECVVRLGELTGRDFSQWPCAQSR